MAQIGPVLPALHNARQCLELTPFRNFPDRFRFPAATLATLPLLRSLFLDFNPATPEAQRAVQVALQAKSARASRGS